MPQPRVRNSAKKRRTFWFDPRFAIGLVLVAASVVGVVAVVAASDSSIDVLAARSDFAPGDTVAKSDLVATSVQVGRADGLYLQPGDVPAEGIVVTRSIAAGELVPASAAGSAAGVRQTAIVLSLTSRLPESVAPGSRVDLWSARAGEGGSFEAPSVIVSSAIVVRLVDEAGLMVNDRGSAVEVLVPRSDIARTLEAVANGAALSAVPSDLPLDG